MRELDPQYAFTPDQIALRNAIGQRLQAGFQAPMAVQLLIVNFLYSPPGLLRIQNPQANLPGWLLADYQLLFESVPATPSPDAAQVSEVSPSTNTAPSTSLPQPDFGVFPATLQELVANRIS